MSESDGEQAARSVALEQAYVHDVYEQCAEKTAQSRHWPRIYKFLEELEPGALVCDIGCGNGKYLTVNDNVFKVGGDRCKRLTDIAREKENEVLICDNLSLPFRDESFDAVLSIAVVHHFATTERRVNALKELARVLRIGGRLVISVWAMEQRHRKFESQDVLVPWPKAYCLNRASSGYSGGKSSAIPSINELDPDRFAQKSLSTSKRAESRKCKRRSYWIDPIFSPSPSTSSLSSPNETCYSFFRRALQKLAGGKRDSENRAWFLETWQNGGCKNRRNMEIDDIGDVDDIPIELRRLEDDTVTMTKLPDAHSIKSKSLGDILEIQRLDLVRSRSSIPGFSSSLTSEFCLDEESKAPSLLGFEGVPGRTCRENSSIDSTARITDYRILGPASMSFSSSSTPPSPSPPPPPPPPPPLSPPLTQLGTFPSSVQQPLSRSFSPNKPRLIKQKTHIPDESSLESPADKYKHTAIQEFFNGIGEIEINPRSKRGNVYKQSSMNEELMSMERLMERDRVRRNIMKQASLNEEIICKPSRTFGHFRETLYSGNATKRFQLIKSGLTNRIKQSTTSMEKVSSMALKNGFVKILQGWTSGESNFDAAAAASVDPDGDESKRCKELSAKRKTSVQSTTVISGSVTGSTTGKPEGETIERRLSKEDGSDSSKDSSLQSDTSVDSEDSFASVIYVPKQQQQRHHNYLDNSQQLHYEHQFPSLIDVTTVPVGGYQLRTTSAPPSPRIKHPPEIHGPRLKLISISPLLKQFPATSKSLPPPSPPRLSPRNFNIFGPPSNIDLSDSTNIVKSDEINEEDRKIDDSKSLTDRTIDFLSPDNDKTALRTEDLVVEEVTEQEIKNTTVEIADEPKCKLSNSDAVSTNKPELTPNVKSIVPAVEFRWGTTISTTETCDNLSEKSSSESIGDEDSRGSRLKQIKELLKQKPGFATRCGKSSFPLVRRASTATSSGRPETIDARTLPRLLSLELFNPETDDLDSDSSGLSSPESVGSVISVISDERFTLKNKDKSGEEAGASSLQVSRVKGVPVDGDDNASSSSIDSQANKWRKDVINDTGQLCNNGKISQVRVDTASKETVEDSTIIKNTHTRLSEKSIIESYDGRSLCLPEDEHKIDQSSRINNCKYNQLMDDTIAWLRGATGSENDNHYSEYTDNNNSCFMPNEKESIERKSSLQKSMSDETMDFMIVSKNGECINGTDVGVESNVIDDKTVVGTATTNIDLLYNNVHNTTVSRQNGNYSSESMEEIEGSISLSSDATTSQTSSLKTSRFCGGSTTCLVSGNVEYKSLRERRRYLYQKRSASEEVPGSGSNRPEVRRCNNDGTDTIVNGRRSSFKSGNLNGSSSQESLLSDYGGDGFGDSSSGGGGGAITYHQYYHVFREGELDQLINKYVENLHIISSYYDHASWCIVAEKVQVWTI